MEPLRTIQKREKLNEIYRHGEPGPGGAYHDYTIVSADHQLLLEHIEFQKGPRKETESRHGVLEVDLLEIVRDRLSQFQKGDFRNEYNAVALRCIEEALYQMNLRVEDRINRGVLGTTEK